MKRKKTKLGLLAVVMAVAMMTACGGGSVSAPADPPASSQPGQQDPAKDPEGGQTEEDPSTAAKSRTEKFFKLNASMGKKYHSKVEYRVNNVLTETVEVASDGVRFREISWSKKKETTISCSMGSRNWDTGSTKRKR